MESNEMHTRSVVGSLMRDAYARAKKGDNSPIVRPNDPSGKPLSEEEYSEIFRHECSYLGNDILSREMLDTRLQQLSDNIAKLKDLIPNGTKFAVGVLPTNDLGDDLQSEDVKRGRYVHDMIINEDGTTASDISMVFGRYFDLLPVELQRKCSLQIGTSDNDREMYADYKRVYNCYIDAFNAWREFLGLEPFTDIERYDIGSENAA